MGKGKGGKKRCVCVNDHVYVCMCLWQELKLKIQELSNMVLSQELIIREVNQQLTDKRHLHETETQRMGSLSQQQQTQISSLQAELGRLQSHLTGQQQSSQQQAEIESLRSELSRAQNQLATQQQSYELRLTSLTTQSNMARQEQVYIITLQHSL